VRACPPDETLIAAAVADARDADAVVAVVGDHIELVGEGRSTATLELIGGQIALLDALIETGIPVIVVLLASKPLVLPASVERAAAVIWAANPGMQGGRAVAEIVLGRVEPSGRLPISFARHVGQQPTYYNQIRGQHGDRYADLTQSPAWAFGEGRSYTRVEYSDLTLSGTEFGVDDTVVAEVTVANTGARPVRETVQLYLRDDVTSASWADKELKGYGQVALEPGASERVRIELPVSDCTIVDARGERVVEAGDFDVLVGSSSRDEALLAARFTVRCPGAPRRGGASGVAALLEARLHLEAVGARDRAGREVEHRQREPIAAPLLLVHGLVLEHAVGRVVAREVDRADRGATAPEGPPRQTRDDVQAVTRAVAAEQQGAPHEGAARREPVSRAGDRRPEQHTSQTRNGDDPAHERGGGTLHPPRMLGPHRCDHASAPGRPKASSQRSHTSLAVG